MGRWSRSSGGQGWAAKENRTELAWEDARDRGWQPPEDRCRVLERRASFDLFRDFTEPYHGVCLRVDCTATYRYAKENHLSVFLSLLHRSLVAAHQVEHFRTRLVDDSVWRYDTIHGGSASVGRMARLGSVTTLSMRRLRSLCARERSRLSGFASERTWSGIPT